MSGCGCSFFTDGEQKPGEQHAHDAVAARAVRWLECLALISARVALESAHAHAHVHVHAHAHVHVTCTCTCYVHRGVASGGSRPVAHERGALLAPPPDDVEVVRVPAAERCRGVSATGQRCGVARRVAVVRARTSWYRGCRPGWRERCRSPRGRSRAHDRGRRRPSRAYS